ncbi:MAG: hypothetical protein ACI9R3_006588 [Verrucomicrobiales bacterium]|jgi:uncharacterized protein YjeT (DUF2065 family)
MKRHCHGLILFGSAVGLLLCSDATAGMTTYGLSDLYRLRLEELSFFIVLLVMCTALFRFLWNLVARDLSSIPSLNWRQATGLSLLVGVLMLLVLTMISGIREVLTPEAWRKQGSSYRLSSIDREPVRKRTIEELRWALMASADANNGQFPEHDFTNRIPDRFWRAPDEYASRYIYFRGKSKPVANGPVEILALEPANFGDERYAIFTSGEVRKLTNKEVDALLGIDEEA